MKQLILTPFLILFFAAINHAQPKIKTFEKDSGYVEVAYFPNGKVSTRKLTPKGSYSRIPGYAKAYNVKGKLIFEDNISSLGGHGNVSFSYHANGVIKSANSTFQPDGGIQRHDVTRYFDEQGNFLREEDNSLPFKPLMLTEPVVKPPAKPEESVPVPKQEEMRCASIAQMRAYVENNSNQNIQIKLIPNSNDKPSKIFNVKPGERIFLADYIMAQQFVDPTMYYKIELVGDNVKQLKMGKWEMQKKSETSAYFIMKVE